MFAELDSLKKELRQIEDLILLEKGKKDQLSESIDKLDKEITEKTNELETLEKVNILFKKTSEFAREQAKSQIESLTSKCLEFIFEKPIKLEIQLEELRGKASAEFYVVHTENDQIIKTRPELSRGGGVVDIVSLALRIAFLEIHKPKVQGPLILDEPAKHVSDEYIYNVANFLKQNSEHFNRQIIMVTHSDHLAAIGSRSYRVDIKDSTSIVRDLDEGF